MEKKRGLHVSVVSSSPECFLLPKPKWCCKHFQWRMPSEWAANCMLVQDSKHILQCVAYRCKENSMACVRVLGPSSRWQKERKKGRSKQQFLYIFEREYKLQILLIHRKASACLLLTGADIDMRVEHFVEGQGQRVGHNTGQWSVFLSLSLSLSLSLAVCLSVL